MAFVVPAEIGHAPYSAPLIEYLSENFSHLQIIAVRRKLFSNLSEDCWLLYADGKGGATAEICLSVLDQFDFRESPPPVNTRVALSEWRSRWNRRLRPFLMPNACRDLYESFAGDCDTVRLGALAQINVGYVSGANDFFHLRLSVARKLGIPDACLQTTVRNARAMPPAEITASTVRRWLREDRQTLLLRLGKNQELPGTVAGLSRDRAGKGGGNQIQVPYAQALVCRT